MQNEPTEEGWHVVATAIRAKAAVIVTDNIQDFAAVVLNAYDLKKMGPEAFCLELLETRPEETLSGLRDHRGSMKRKAFDPQSYLAYLDAELGLQRLSKALAGHIGNL